MSRIIRGVLFAGGLIVAAGVLPASAQVYKEVTFKTTFPFQVGTKTLPAGSYSVRPAYDGDSAVLEIIGDGGSALFFGENAGVPNVEPKDTSVTFDRTGDHYVLARIWDEPTREGAEMIPGARVAPRPRRRSPRQVGASRPSGLRANGVSYNARRRP